MMKRKEKLAHQLEVEGCTASLPCQAIMISEAHGLGEDEVTAHQETAQIVHRLSVGAEHDIDTTLAASRTATYKVGLFREVGEYRAQANLSSAKEVLVAEGREEDSDQTEV